MPSNLQKSIAIPQASESTLAPNTTGGKSRISHGLLRWSPWLVSLTLAACASFGGGGETQVSQRASERWKALVAGEFNKAYSYSTPSFREVVTADGFRSRHGSAVVWVGAEVVSVVCPEPAKCTAVIRLDYKPLKGGRTGAPFSTHLDETWLLEAGQWWVFQPLTGS